MRRGQRTGPPTWFVILLGIAIVFGLYYLLLGLRNFMASGATVVESTRQAIVESTATAIRIVELEHLAPTPLPSFTPVPTCQDFVVIVPSAIIRSAPTTRSEIVGSAAEGEIVCVIAKEADSEWYVLDKNTLTRRLEPVYMHEDIIRAVNPTPTPTRTFTPSPTPRATQTPRPSATPLPSPTPPRERATIMPTATPSATPGSVNL